jgi:hypothetical protein
MCLACRLSDARRHAAAARRRRDNEKSRGDPDGGGIGRVSCVHGEGQDVWGVGVRTERCRWVKDSALLRREREGGREGESREARARAREGGREGGRERERERERERVCVCVNSSILCHVHTRDRVLADSLRTITHVCRERPLRAESCKRAATNQTWIPTWNARPTGSVPCSGTHTRARTHTHTHTHRHAILLILGWSTGASLVSLYIVSCYSCK